MNATEAKNLLRTVPHNKFLLKKFTNGKNKCCGIGHLVRLTSDDPENYLVENCADWTNNKIKTFVRLTVRSFLQEKGTLATVNNTQLIYTELLPKDRIMHLLDDMIAAGH